MGGSLQKREVRVICIFAAFICYLLFTIWQLESTINTQNTELFKLKNKTDRQSIETIYAI